MDLRDLLGMGQAENISEVLEVLVRAMVGKSFAPNGRLVKLEPLDHGPHGPIEQQDSLADQFRKEGGSGVRLKHFGSSEAGIAGAK